MRTINFNEEDIKQCKLALAKQNLTSLQSAFLMQHITNIEQENKQLKEAIDKAIELTNNFAFKILIDNRTMYIRLKDLEQGKDLLKMLEEVSK